MKKLQFPAILSLCITMSYAEEHFYKITVDAIDNGDQIGFYVKSDLDAIQMAMAMCNKEAIIFRQYYVYISTTDKWETVDKWDDLRSGTLIVRGDNIVFVEKLVGNPENHESKSRLFRSVPVKKAEVNE